MSLLRLFTDSLRARVLLLVLLGFASVAVPAFFAFQWVVNSTVVQLGTLFAEKQVLYDRHTTSGADPHEPASWCHWAGDPLQLADAIDVVIARRDHAIARTRPS